MARKRSILDDLSTLPWWFNLVLAAIVYVVLKVIVPAIEPDNPIFKGIFQMLPGLAGVFSLIICLVALVSAHRAWKRGELFSRQTSLSSIRALTWQQFEQYIGEAYRRKGYSVEETGLGGADGGVDLILRKDGKTLLVQCKNWKRNKVGVSVVRELFGLVKARDASGGVLVTAGRYTQDAKKFANETGVELVDGERLVKLVNSVADKALIGDSDTDSGSVESLLLCPVCGSDMVQRVAQKGKFKGNTFFGCSRYPDCKGIRNSNSE